MALSTYSFYIFLCVGLVGIFVSDRHIRRISARLGNVSFRPPTAAAPAGGWKRWGSLVGGNALSLIGLLIVFKTNYLLAHVVVVAWFGELAWLAYVHRVMPLVAKGATRRDVAGLMFSVLLIILPLAWALHVFLNRFYGAGAV